MKKVFIDGSAGTTGLRIQERLSIRNDLQLLMIDEKYRKDPSARADCINSSDVSFFCLPDDAAIEAAALVSNPDTIIIDTSTAHRTNPAWAYGFPELSGLREKILSHNKIANPGCHASGFISLVAPLVEHGILSKTAHLSAFSLTGYSGGGKKMISDYEAEANAAVLQAPRMYGLTLSHKHLPEMKLLCNLDSPPVFAPIVSSYYSGMEVVVPLFTEDINGSMQDIKELYKSYYTGKLVQYVDASDENGFLSAGALSGYDNMQISVFGNEKQIQLVSRFDNLGKGASGAAIQNMNIALGLEETTGLNLPEVSK